MKANVKINCKIYTHSYKSHKYIFISYNLKGAREKRGSFRH